MAASNDDYDYLTSFVRVLSDDDTLKGLVDYFEVDFPMVKVTDRLGGPNTTMLSVSMPHQDMKGSWGSATSRIQETKAIIQVDIASQYGDNASYVRKVATRVRDLLFLWVDETLDSTRFQVYTDNIITWLDFDPETKSWHAVVSVNVRYFRVAPS